MRSSLIEASAGTGKTHFHVSLYILALLQAGENNFSSNDELIKFLVVTYTEMATRVKATYSGTYLSNKR